MKTITGLIHLSNGILCKCDALGQIYDTIIAGVNVKIHFPQIPVFDEDTPKTGLSQPLLAPEIAKSWKRGDESLEWGYPVCYPSGDSAVELLVLSAECDESDCIEKARVLFSDIKAWGNAFFDYLNITTKQGANRDKNTRSRADCHLELVGMKHIPGLIAGTIYGYIHSPDMFASKQQIEDALLFAASGKELHLEYQMLLSSYRARRASQNRQAIIDACSAVELCLEDYITRKVAELEMNPKLFLDKFKSLGDRFDLIKQLDNTLPEEDYQAIIVKPRNDIAHNREVFPSDRITDQLIACVERCLQHFFAGYN